MIIYLIQTWDGATLHSFTLVETRDKKLAELQARYPRTMYTTKEITR